MFKHYLLILKDFFDINEDEFAEFIAPEADFLFFHKLMRPGQHLIKSLVFGVPTAVGLKMDYDTRIAHCEIASEEPTSLQGNV